MNNLISLLTNNKDSNLREVLFKGGTAFILKIFSLFLGYLVMFVITRNFGAEVFGRYSIGITFSQLLVMIFTLGLSSSVVRLTSDINFYHKTPKSNYLKKSLSLLMGVGAIVSFLLYSTSDIIAIKLFNDENLKVYFKLLSFFIVPMMFHEFLSNFFRGKKDFFKYNLFTFVLPNSIFFIFYYLLISKFIIDEEVTFLSYGLGITLIFVFEIILYFKAKYSAKENFPTKKLLKLSIPMMFSAAFLFLIGWTDIFMLGLMKSSSDVGVYNVVFKVSSVGYLIIIAINVVIAPKISELYSVNQLLPLKKIINQSTRLIAILTLPLIGILILFRKPLLLVFGEEFLQGETALIIISLGVLFNAFCGNVDQILNMTNHQKILRNITIICFFINIILNYFLISIYGINGAAIASLITNIVLNVICVYYIKKTLGFYTLF